MIEPSWRDGGDGPGVAVADRLTCAGDESAVVAAGRHDVTDVDGLAGGDPCRHRWVEVAGVEAGGLDGVVDGVDVIVRRRDDRRGCARWRGGRSTPGSDPGEVVVEGAGDDPAVGFVGVEGGGVTASQLQGRGGFPGVGEAVEAFELVDAAVDAQLGEQATPTDALQLAGVADQGEAPPVPSGERRRPGDRAGVDSIPASSTISVAPAGSWYSGSGGRSVRCHSWSSLATVSARMPVSRSTVRAAFAVGATANTTRPCSSEVVAGGGEHAGLAGPGRADHQHQPVVAGDRCGGVGLQRIQPVAVDAWSDGVAGSAWAAIAQVRIASSWARTASDV